MNDRIRFRQCCSADVDTLKRLWTVCFLGDSREDIDAFFSRAYSQSVAFAGFDGDDAVVMLYLLPAYASNSDCRIPVWYLYAGGTHPGYRSRGLYRQLMTIAREWATESNRHAIYLHPADSGLYELYAALGYKRPLVSMKPMYVAASRPVPLDDYFAERKAVSDTILVWEPDIAIAELFKNPDWRASLDEKGNFWLTDADVAIERLPLSLGDCETITTAVWIPTTKDAAILARLEATVGYSLIYGD